MESFGQNCCDSHTTNTAWRSFDDSKVKSTSHHHLVTRSAYVLVYRRKNYTPPSPIFDLFSSCVNNQNGHNDDDDDDDDDDDEDNANADECHQGINGNNPLDFNGNFIPEPSFKTKHSSYLKNCVKNLFNVEMNSTSGSNRACGDGGANVDNNFNSSHEVFYDAKEFFSNSDELLCDEATPASHIDNMLDNCNINNNIGNNNVNNNVGNFDVDNNVGICNTNPPGNCNNNIGNDGEVGTTNNSSSCHLTAITEELSSDDDDDFMNLLD